MKGDDGLEAARPVAADLLARLTDLAVVADEELVDEHRLGVLGGHLSQPLSEWASDVARVHREPNLVCPRHPRALRQHLRVQHRPRRRAQLVIAPWHEEAEVEPR